MVDARLFICAAAVVLTAATAAAETATTNATVNLRSGAGTDTTIVAKIPARSRVDAANCREWCKVAWQGKQGFAIATALDRGTPRDPYATDAGKGDVPMSAGAYEAPGRYHGPYFWGSGPAVGPYKGRAGIGYRGSW